MTRQEAYVAELSQLLFYMTPWDKAVALKNVNKLFAEAENEAELLDELGTPMKLAVTLHRSYEPTPEPTPEELAARAAEEAAAAQAQEKPKADAPAEEPEADAPAEEAEAEADAPAEEAEGEVDAPAEEAEAEVDVPAEEPEAEVDVPAEEPEAEMDEPAEEAKAEIDVPGEEAAEETAETVVDTVEETVEEAPEAIEETLEPIADAAEDAAEAGTEPEAEEEHTEERVPETAEARTPWVIEESPEKEKIFAEIFNAATEAQSAVVPDELLKKETKRKARYLLLLPYTIFAILVGVPGTIVFAAANVVVVLAAVSSLVAMVYLVIFHLFAAMDLGSKLILLGLSIVMLALTIILGVFALWFLHTATLGFPRFLREIAMKHCYREVEVE